MKPAYKICTVISTLCLLTIAVNDMYWAYDMYQFNKDYIESDDTTCRIRAEDGSLVPCDFYNQDYLEQQPLTFMEWI